MKTHFSFCEFLSDVNDRISQDLKLKLSGLAIMLVIVAALDLMSLGAAVVFLQQLILDGNSTQSMPFQFLGEIFDLDNDLDTSVYVFATFIGLASLVKIFILRVQVNASHQFAFELSTGAYKSVLAQCFAWHLDQSKSTIASNVIVKTSALGHVVALNFLLLISSSILFLILIFGIIYGHN